MKELESLKNIAPYVCGPLFAIALAKCCELRTSAALLENIGRFLLTITENMNASLLGLRENELTILRTNSKTSVSAYNH